MASCGRSSNNYAQQGLGHDPYGDGQMSETADSCLLLIETFRGFTTNDPGMGQFLFKVSRA